MMTRWLSNKNKKLNLFTLTDYERPPFMPTAKIVLEMTQNYEIDKNVILYRIYSRKYST